MRQNNGSSKKCFTQYSQNKRPPIQYYLQKISLIKNNHFQLNSFYTNPQMITNTDFNSTFSDIRKHQLSLQSKKKNYHKKRSLSTKTEIEFTPNPKPSKLNAKTQYPTQNCQQNHSNLFSKISIPDERIKQRTATNFKLSLQRRKNLSQNKNHLSLNKIVTQPCVDSNREHSQRLMTQYPQQIQQMMTSIREQVQQNSQTVKKDIFTKISLYVQSLDQKGQQQLNQMLVGKYKKHIKCHSDVVLYQQRVKQMIKTNKEIVSMLKDQFLSPRKVRQFSQRNAIINGVKNSVRQIQQMDIQSQSNKIVIDELQVYVHPQKSLPSFQNQPKQPKGLAQKNSTKPILMMQTSQSLSQIQQLQNSQQQIDSPSQQQPHDFNQQMKHVTNQFVTQWQKSKLHKKQIYTKFRKTLFKKFPQLKQRQQKRNKQLNIKPKQNDQLSELQVDSQNEDIFNSKIHLDGLKEAQLKANLNKILLKSPLKKNQIQQKNYNDSNQFTDSPQKQIHLIKNSSVNNQKEELLNLKKTTTELSKSLSKITLLSKKNSISKGSTRTLSIFTAENKRQVDKFNFQNLVEFIFKRAFFYSVSKKKIIQNKTEMIPLEIVSPVEKRKPDFSFIKYNSKAQEKRYLRVSKLNEKKLRATGTFLIKNKFNIMQMQHQGHKSYDFLRKCIEDAIQDYLDPSKKK